MRRRAVIRAVPWVIAVILAAWIPAHWADSALAAARGGAARPPRGGQRGPDRPGGGHANRDDRDNRADNDAGGGGRWRPGIRRVFVREPAPDILRRLSEQTLARLLADGWSALRAGEPEAAAAAFLDALQVKGDCAEAALGLAMANACASNWKPAQTMLERLAGDASLPAPVVRMATYNLAALHARQNQPGRAILLLHRKLEAAAAPDELFLRAQMSLVARLSDSERKTLAILPAVLKTIDQHKEKAAAARTGQTLWGLAWVSRADAERLRAAGTPEVYARELPFILPDGSTMPLKGQKPPVNELHPDWAAARIAPALAALPPRAASPPGSPAAPAAPPDNTVATPAAPAVPAVPAAPASPAAPPPSPAAPAPALAVPDVPAAVRTAPPTVTLRGAAFAVAPDRALTWSGLVAGAARVTVAAPGDGKPHPAEVVAIDTRAGLALLKIERGGMAPMAIAPAARPGEICAATFARPTVFQPIPELLAGNLVNSAGKWTARLETHPRVPGGPVVDFDGNVLGILIAARTDPADRLPVIPAEVIRQFCAAHQVQPTARTAGDVQDCVLEVEATRTTAAD